MSRQMVIIGLGLIGGSMAKALKSQEPDCHIVGIDTDSAARALLLDEGGIDEADARLSPAMTGSADVILIATSPGSWKQLAERLRDLPLKSGVLMMDVGSIKAYALECFGGLPGFVAAHPIAGSQFSGAAFSTGELFQQKQVILTPASESGSDEAGPYEQAKRFWETLGALTREMDPATHDAVYAYVSHLPQFVAYALAHATLAEASGSADYLAFLRLAGSSPALWLDIFRHNPSFEQAADTFLRVQGHMLGELRSGMAHEAVAEEIDLDTGLRLLPRMVASSLVSTVYMEEGKRDMKLASYAGAGFADMTHPAMTPPDDDLSLISQYAGSVVALLERFDGSLRVMLGAIKQGQWNQLEQLLEQAHHHYLQRLQ